MKWKKKFLMFFQWKIKEKKKIENQKSFKSEES